MQMPKLIVARARGEGQHDRVMLVPHSEHRWLQLLDCARQQKTKAQASCVLAHARELPFARACKCQSMCVWCVNAKNATAPILLPNVARTRV